MYVNAEISKNQQPEMVFNLQVTAYMLYFDFHFQFHLCHDEIWFDSSIKENSKHIALSLSVPTIHTDTNLSIFHNYGLPTLLKYVLSVLNRLKTTQKDKPESNVCLWYKYDTSDVVQLKPHKLHCTCLTHLWCYLQQSNGIIRHSTQKTKGIRFERMNGY